MKIGFCAIWKNKLSEYHATKKDENEKPFELELERPSSFQFWNCKNKNFCGKPEFRFKTDLFGDGRIIHIMAHPENTTKDIIVIFGGTDKNGNGIEILKRIF